MSANPDSFDDSYDSTLDSLDSNNTSGTSAYQPDTTTSSVTGAVVNTAQNPLPAPDASGGNGSILSPLQSVFTQGLDDSVVSASEFGLGSLTDRLNVNANASVQPASAPGTAAGVQTAGPSLTQVLLIAAIAYLIYETVR